jgi:hypothetical protein
MKISITPGSTLPAQVNFAYWRAWGPTLLLALILAASIVTFLDKWLWSNEVFNNLPMGVSYESGEQGLTRLRNEALHYCDQFAAPDDLKACRIYQDSVTDRLYFAHPLTALLGLQVRGLLGEPDWLQRLHWIAIELPLVSGVLALVIWSMLTMALPGPERGMAVSVTLCLLLISYGHDRNFAPLPDAVRDAGTWLAPTTLLLVAIAAFVLARRRAVIWPSLIASPDATRTLFRAALVLVILSVALPPAFNAVLAPVAMVALLLGALPVAAGATSFRPAVFAAALGMLFVAVSAAPIWFLRRFGYASSLASLVYMATIALATIKPNSRMVWVMPAMALFHLPVAALLGAATTIAELLLALIRRRPSHLLGAASITAAVGISGVVFLIESTAFTPGSARPADAIGMILHWPGLLPAVAAIALSFAFALIAGRMDEGRGIGLARAGLLITGGLTIVTIAAALQDQDPTLLNAPGFALFAKSGEYATPALFLTGILLVCLSLGSAVLPPGADRAYTATPRGTVLLVVSVLLLITVAKTDLRLRYAFLPAPLEFWRFLVAGELHPEWCRHLRQASLADETYYLSPANPMNDPIIYWSAMKARLRIEANLLQPDAMIFRPAADDPEGCSR